MIKLGKLTESSLNKQFPDNWKSIAVMMALPWEMFDNDEVISIEIDNNTSVDIHADNSFTCTAPLPKEIVAQLIVEAVKLKRAK